MGNVIILAGEKANFLTNATVDSIAGAIVDIDYPLTNLYDGRTSQPTKWTTTAATVPFCSIDLNVVQNGSMDNWATSTDLFDWTETTVGGASSVTREATIVVSGNSTKLTVGTGGTAKAEIYSTPVWVKTGQTMHIEAQLRGSGSAAVNVFVKNLSTGKFWNGSAWASSGTTLTRTPATFSNITANFTVEDFATTGLDVVQLQFVVSCTTASATVYVDDLFCWPDVDFLYLGAHNLSGACGLQLHSDTALTFASATLRGSISALTYQYSPTCRIVLGSPVSARFWRVQATNYSVGMPDPQISEIWLGAKYTGPRCVNLPWEQSRSFDDTTNQMANGDQHTFSKSPWQRRSYQMQFTYPATATEVAFRNEVFVRSKGRTLPFVCVPDDAFDDNTVLCKIDRTWTVTRIQGEVWEDSVLAVQELAHFNPS